MTTDPLRLRVRIDAKPDAVFSALTDPDQLTEWMCESAEVALEDGRYEFWGRYTPQGDRARQSLTAQEAGRRLTFTWALEQGPSTVEFELEPADEESTVVTATHSGVTMNSALLCFWYVSMANLVAHSEGVQTMPPFDFSVPAQGDALVRTVIDAPPEEVFVSLLDPAQVNKWAGGSAVIEPKQGGRYDFGYEHGPKVITEFEQDRVLAYSWLHADGPETVARWSLRSSRGSTYVTLVHSGFASDTVAEEFRQEWPVHLVELKRLIELGDKWEPLKV